MLLFRSLIVLAVFISATLLIYPWRMQVMKDHERNSYDTYIAQQANACEKELAATATLPTEDPRRTAAWLNMADIWWRKNDLVTTEKILSELWMAKDQPKRAAFYDPQFAQIMMKTAAVHLDMGKLDDARKNYDSVLWYDTHYPLKDMDACLARDYDNLGVAYYLLALKHEKRADGMPEYKKAIEYFDMSIDKYKKAYGKPDSQYIANVQYNESLAARDSGQTQLAKTMMDSSKRIAALVKHASYLP